MILTIHVNTCFFRPLRTQRECEKYERDMMKAGLTLILQRKAWFLTQLILQASETMLYSGNLYCLLIMNLEVLGGGPHHHLKADKVLQGAYPGRPELLLGHWAACPGNKVRGEMRKGGQVDAGIWPPTTCSLSKVFKTRLPSSFLTTAGHMPCHMTF